MRIKKTKRTENRSLTTLLVTRPGLCRFFMQEFLNDRAATDERQADSNRSFKCHAPEVSLW